MSIQKIQVSEYTCGRCGYRWVNRNNGKDKLIPKRCAKCKSGNWNRIGVTPQEKGLRRRIRGFEKLYDYAGYYFENFLGNDAIIHWPNDLTEQFLNLNPRPTISELIQVVYPKGLILKPIDSQNQFSGRGYVPDPKMFGQLKYDPGEYVKLRRFEALRRQEIMIQIIKSRTG